MLRTAFENDLQSLEDQILSLGSEVEENIIKAVNALLRRDAHLSRQLIRADFDVNEKRIQIGLNCLSLIARQQPMAGDMRRIAAIIEIVGELERIHDYVKGIAKINLMIGAAAVHPALVNMLPEMAERTTAMLRQALQAFTRKDADLARAIPQEDDAIDDLFNEIYREIIQYARQNPEAIQHINQLEWAMHNLERSADRVTNICEWVVYMVTGEYVEMDSEIEAPPEMNMGESKEAPDR